MGKFIVVVPYGRIMATGVFLGIGLVIGVKIGSALLKIAAPHLSKLQSQRR